MPDKPNFLTMAEEIINEDMEIMREFFQEELLPLIKYRENLEKKIFDREYKSLKELEEEA